MRETRINIGPRRKRVKGRVIWGVWKATYAAAAFLGWVLCHLAQRFTCAARIASFAFSLITRFFRGLFEPYVNAVGGCLPRRDFTPSPTNRRRIE
jgi:hypothetical protein